MSKFHCKDRDLLKNNEPSMTLMITTKLPRHLNCLVEHYLLATEIKFQQMNRTVSMILPVVVQRQPRQHQDEINVIMREIHLNLVGLVGYQTASLL